MSKPILRYISLWNGRCGLTTKTRDSIYREQGTDNVKYVRNATEKDVAWVAGMGGDVPKSYRIATEGDQA